jgi:hypothetical protein
VTGSERSENMFLSGQFNSIVAALLIAVGLVLNGLLPRYQIASIGESGAYVRRFDTWTGRVCTQRMLGTEEEWKAERGNKWQCHRRTMVVKE